MRRLSVLCNLIAVVAGLMLPPSLHGQPQPAAGTTQRLVIPASPGADAGPGTVQFIGTATVLIRYHGFTILTDPNFLHKDEQVLLGYGLSSKRLTDPALELQQLPPIDLVVLSHFHEDHFDRRVQDHLNRDTLLVSTHEAASQLKRIGFRRTVPLSTWDALEITKGQARLTVTAMPGRHGPPVVNALLLTIMGSMLEFTATPAQPRYRMYLSGDTLVFDAIALIPHRFPGINLALLHLGGTRILKAVKVTMDGKDRVDMLNIIAPEHAIPIHYNDYDIFKSPLSEFESQVRAAGLEQKIIYLKHGESYTFGNSATPVSAPAPQ